MPPRSYALPGFPPQLDDPLNAMLGLESPTLEPEADPEEFDPGGWFGAFLERLGAGYQGSQVAPTGFGTGLLQGLMGGLAGQGQQIAKRRATFEAGQEKRAKERGAANLKATEDYRSERSRRLQEAGRELRSERERRTVYERDFLPVPDDAPAWVRRVADSEGRVPRSVLVEALKPENTAQAERDRRAADKERIVAIEGADGRPVYVRESEALGKVPASPRERVTLKPPSAAERGDLITDADILSQVGRIRDAYHPGFVGPVSGRVGGISQATGIPVPLRRGGEATFRSRVAALRNQILKARSGGAVTEGEASRLLEELPIPSDPSGVFERKLDNFESTYRNIAQTRRDVLGSTGVDLSRMPPLPRQRVQPADQPAGGPATDEDHAAYEAYLRRAGGR